MSGESGNRDDDVVSAGEVDSGVLGRALLARRRRILGWTLGALLLSTAIVNILTTRYTAEAGVVIESQANFFTSSTSTGNGNPQQPPDEADVSTQVEVLKSRDLALAAIRKLHLQGNPEFDPLAGAPGAISRLEMLIGLKHDPSKMTREDGMLDNFAKALTVFSPTKTRFLNIDFSSRDPRLAAAGANAVAQLYMQRQGAAKQQEAKAAADALGARLDSLRQRLAEAEAKAEDFRLKNGLVDGRNHINMSAQQLDDLNTQLSKARAEESDARAKAQMIRQMVKSGRIGDVSDIVNSNLVRRIYEQRVTVSAQLAQQSRTLLPGHPVIKALRAQLADIDQQLAGAAKKTAAGLENEAKLAALKVDNLKTALSQQTEVAGQASHAEVELRKLTDDAGLIRKTLEADTAKFQEQEARAQASETPVDARMVSRAVVPQTPSFPKKIPIILVSTLAGFVMSAGAVLAKELLKVPAAPWQEEPSDTSDDEGLEAEGKRREPTVPPLAPFGASLGGGEKSMMTHAPGTADEQLFQDRRPALRPAESVSAIMPVESLVARLTGAASSNYALLSLIPALRPVADAARPEALSALAIARPLAAQARVLLVNLDAESFDIDALVDRDDAPGISDLVAGSATYAEVIHRDPQTRLHIIGYGNGALQGRDGLDEVLEVLGESYDQVLLFCRVQIEGLSAEDLAPLADYVILNDADQLDAATAGRIKARFAARGAGNVLMTQSVVAPSRLRRRGAV